MQFLFFFLLTISVFSQQNLLWFDATANFRRLSSEDSIRFYLSKAKECGFTDVVVDVKPITGETLFPSQYAPQMLEWQGVKREKSFNFLKVFIDNAHKLNVKVHASLNIFVAGHNFFDRGLIYNDKSHWQSFNYTDSGIVPITKLKHKYSAMTNPALREVQVHELNILKELVKNYTDLDGIILDRVRYDGMEADFSNESRKAFEQYIGEQVPDFPESIFQWTKNAKGEKQRKEGPYFRKWLEWRASVIYHFIAEARAEIKALNPNILFGDYTGAWYPLYFEVGANWASSGYDPSIEYDWATPEYKNYGYAELLDLYTSGCYFFEVTKSEVEKLNEEKIARNEAGMGEGKEYWYSVEGSAEIAQEVINGAVPVIGGLYVEQYRDNPEQFSRAVKMCLEKTAGLMIFDIVHIIDYKWWDVLKQAMQK